MFTAGPQPKIEGGKLHCRRQPLWRPATTSTPHRGNITQQHPHRTSLQTWTLPARALSRALFTRFQDLVRMADWVLEGWLVRLLLAQLHLSVAVRVADDDQEKVSNLSCASSIRASPSFYSPSLSSRSFYFRFVGYIIPAGSGTFLCFVSCIPSFIRFEVLP